MTQSPAKKSFFNRNVDLMNGPIFKSLLVFMLPILVSCLFQQLYNTVDTMIVGTPPMTVDMPSLLSRSAGVYRRTDTPSTRHTPLILTGSSVTLQSIRMCHDASRASL